MAIKIAHSANFGKGWELAALPNEKHPARPSQQCVEWEREHQVQAVRPVAVLSVMCQIPVPTRLIKLTAVPCGPLEMLIMSVQ